MSYEELHGVIRSLQVQFMGLNIHILLHGLTALVTALLVWRLWRFTISPKIHPDDPKELPYWIPVIGHGFAFFRSSDSLIAKASEYFGTKEPYSLTVFGNTLYIVTEPHHTTEVYKNDETLSFEMFVQDLFTSNGYSRKGLDATYAKLPRDKSGFPNPQGVSFGSFVQQMHMHQLYPGKNLQVLEDNFRNWFDRNLSLLELKKMCSQYATIGNDGSIEMLLGRWCSDISIRSGEDAYFGDMLSRINPTLADDFIAFDDLGWQVLYQYPSFLSREMSAARAKVQHSFREYLKIPQKQRSASGAIWLINAMEDEAKALGVCTEDIAVLLFNIYWVISTNTRKVAFWLLVNLLYAPSLIDVVRAETSSAFQGDELVNPSHLWANCPQLENIWHETLRLCSNAASVRHVDRDTVIGGKLMREGNRIMIPYRQLHFETSVYGADSHRFRPDRFGESNKGTALTRGPSWRPFGGGKTLCTGRHAAKRATLIFVATLLRRFNIEMIGNPPLPEPDLGRPVLGISSFQKGHDLTVRLSVRKRV
ncbi:putative cytochrome p450 [Hypomontagnella monticulosa]|nr:putative cytochrome p450 [Hypomontagnella monticulosa]